MILVLCKKAKIELKLNAVGYSWGKRWLKCSFIFRSTFAPLFCQLQKMPLYSCIYTCLSFKAEYIMIINVGVSRLNIPLMLASPWKRDTFPVALFFFSQMTCFVFVTSSLGPSHCVNSSSFSSVFVASVWPRAQQGHPMDHLWKMVYKHQKSGFVTKTMIYCWI